MKKNVCPNCHQSINRQELKCKRCGAKNISQLPKTEEFRIINEFKKIFNYIFLVSLLLFALLYAYLTQYTQNQDQFLGFILIAFMYFIIISFPIYLILNLYSYFLELGGSWQEIKNLKKSKKIKYFVIGFSLIVIIAIIISLLK